MKVTPSYHVSFVGAGNVAYHLATSLKRAGLTIDEVCSPNRANRNSLAKAVDAQAPETLLNLTPISDFYIIAVPDDKIESVVNAMPEVNGIVAHTSGITPMQTISNRFKSSGVFYPLQTFSKQRTIAMNTVPFCIEGNTKQVETSLTQLAGTLSQSIHYINSNQRKELHLAAVFVSNFTNYLYQAGETLLNDQKLPFELLIPLIEEVAAKVKTLSPSVAQTGPARRNDKNTLKTHVEMLHTHPGLKSLYQLITSQIINQYHE